MKYIIYSGNVWYLELVNHKLIVCYTSDLDTKKIAFRIATVNLLRLSRNLIDLTDSHSINRKQLRLTSHRLQRVRCTRTTP